MAILKSKDIVKMGESERVSKLKELKIELIKSRVSGKRSSKLSSGEIKKVIARILTCNNDPNKKTNEEKKKKDKVKELKNEKTNTLGGAS